jgi:hypothetical protein
MQGQAFEGKRSPITNFGDKQDKSSKSYGTEVPRLKQKEYRIQKIDDGRFVKS